MKKIMFGIALMATTCLTGCNSCTKAVKDLESDWADLDRDVVVLNAFTGDTLFKYSGPCYISAPHEASNQVTLIYKTNDGQKKADWVGGGFVFQAIEKENK